jgi:O-antigen ligase
VLYSVISFVTLTLPQGASGVGAKYGGFTLLLYFKYVLVAWAASHIPLDEERVAWIHRAALLALLWVAATSLASRFGLLDLRVFTSRLPAAESGRWAGALDSTVGKQNQTPVTMLLLAGLALVTTDYRKRWLTTVLVIGLGTFVAVLTGSRQGAVRFVAFTALLLAWRGGKLLVGLAYTALLAGFVLDAGGALAVSPGSRAETALQRQRVLFQDPLTDDALSGRPIIWARTIETLHKHPRLFLTGAGIGSYVKYGGASHNMILQLLLEGGVVALLLYIVCYGALFRLLWRIRDRAWAMVAVTAALLTSLMTSEVLYPTLATGWYLGLYFVSLHIAAGIPRVVEMPGQAAPALQPEGGSSVG